ncbi:MAG: hypothetical protein KJ754_01965 [Bacteroidetes bacterium]|nr:hypothetical protein [Bacteroidota bacterium]MBU1578167.1 hypothetical protein [Bacteroidota bacterium]
MQQLFKNEYRITPPKQWNCCTKDEKVNIRQLIHYSHGIHPGSRILNEPATGMQACRPNRTALSTYGEASAKVGKSSRCPHKLIMSSTLHQNNYTITP